VGALDHRDSSRYLPEKICPESVEEQLRCTRIQEKIASVCCSKASDSELITFCFAFQPQEKTIALPVASPVDSSSFRFTVARFLEIYIDETKSFLHCVLFLEKKTFLAKCMSKLQTF